MKHHIMPCLWLLIFLFLVLAPPVYAAAETVDLPAAEGGTMRIWYDSPTTPWAAVISFVGADGDIGLMPDGQFKLGSYFLARTRQYWRDRGVAVVLPDKLALLPNSFR